MEVTLYARTAKSNKFYTVQLEERKDGLWYLTGISGPIGGTVMPQPKLGGKGVDYETGLKAYNSLIREKLTGGSGYVLGEDAPAVQLSNGAPKPDATLPSHMLLLDMEEGDLERLINDPDWIFEQKHDGNRCRIFVQDGKVSGMSRQDLPMSLPMGVVDLIKAKGDAVYDGELIGETYFCFDLLRQNTVNWWKLPARARAKEVLHLFPVVHAAVVGTPFVDTPEEKRHLVEFAHENGFEGIVAKKNVAYAAGDSGLALRLKFRKSGTVVCTGPRTKKGVEKNSFGIALGDGTPLGSVTVYPNQTMPPAGAIVEVSYLYRHNKGGKLIQPVFLSVRMDKSAADCTADQFQVKGEKRK